MHAPIHGSQINPPAKLYKRFTPTETVSSDGTEITVENNRYRTFCSLRYVEATDRQDGEEQPINGLVSRSGYMTVKYNGKYKPEKDSPYEAETGDVLEIEEELWIVEDDVQRVRVKSLKNFATVYLPLKKIL